MGVKAQGDELTLTRARVLVGALGGHFPGIGVRAICVSAANSGALSGPLATLNKGNIFVGRLRVSLLDKRASITIRDTGSLPAGVTSKLRVSTILPENDCNSIFIAHGGFRAGSNFIVKANDLEQELFTRGVCPGTGFGSVENGISAQLGGLLGNRCSTLILTGTKLRELSLYGNRSCAMAPFSASRFLPTPYRKVVTVRDEGGDRISGVLTRVDSGGAVLSFRARERILRDLGTSYSAPINTVSGIRGSEVALSLSTSYGGAIDKASRVSGEVGLTGELIDRVRWQGDMCYQYKVQQF